MLTEPYTKEERAISKIYTHANDAQNRNPNHILSIAQHLVVVGKTQRSLQKKINALNRQNKELASKLARREGQVQKAHEFIELLKGEKQELEERVINSVIPTEVGHRAEGL